MSFKITKTIITATANDSVTEEDLDAELLADADIIADDADYEGCSCAFSDPENPTKRISVDMFFDVEPGQDAKDAVDTVLTAHQGVTPEILKFQTTVAMLTTELSVTEDGDWECIGGTVARLTIFGPLGKLLGKMIGGCKVTEGGGGEKPQVRILEEQAGEAAVELAKISLDDSAAAWTTFQKKTTTTPRKGRNTYKLEARLNGAASLDIRFVNITVFRNSADV